MPDRGPTPAEAPGLLVETLHRYLATEVPGVRPDVPLEAVLLAGGRSNVSYLISQGDRSWVLRRPPLGHVMPTAHDMGREHRVLSGLTRVGFRVPRPLTLCEDSTVIGAPFMVMDYVEGRVLATADDASGVTPIEAGEISTAFVETLVQLHAVDVAAAQLSQLGRPEGYLGRQVRRWLQQWERSRTRELDGVARLGSWLQAQVDVLPAGLPWSVVHGDYRLDNVIVAHDAPDVVAVLDWEMSTLGDPVADLAVALVYWSRPGETLRHRVPVATGVTDVPGFAERSELVSAYAAASGRDLSHLDVCLALACLKLAVIMESIHYRSLRGQQLGTASQGGIDMGAATEALVDLGLAVASGEGLNALSR
jgi:aminoglycoside phosphotransferase (APT) family kinase protein